MIFLDVPDKPYNILLKPCTFASTTISWNSGSSNHVPVNYFLLHYNASRLLCLKTFCSKSQTTFTPLKIPAYQQSIMLKLKSFYNYSFVLEAHNRIGSSSLALVTNKDQLCNVPADMPSRNPSKLCGGSGLNGNLKVTWEPLTVDDINGPYFYYAIKYYKLNQNKHSLKNTVEQTDITHLYHIIKLYNLAQNNHTITLEPLPVQTYFLEPWIISIASGNAAGELEFEEEKIVYARQLGNSFQIQKN